MTTHDAPGDPETRPASVQTDETRPETGRQQPVGNDGEEITRAWQSEATSAP